jgi:hypothetical protein
MESSTTAALAISLERLLSNLLEASAFRIVRFWIGEVRCGRQNLQDAILSGRPPLDDLNIRILDMFDKSFFESARSMEETVPVNRATMLRYLHKYLGFKLFNLH